MKWVVVLVLVLVSAGCRASNERPAPSPPTGNATNATCTTPTPFGVGGTAHEVHGVSRDAQLWGLALGPGNIPPRVGDELKIVWRMTGHGPLHIALTAPDGRRPPLVFGPEAHPASSYSRPGDEWGTGFRFVTPGCWHIHFARDDASADVWLNI